MEPASPSAASNDTARSIEEAVRGVLSGHGIDGTVRVVGDQLELHGRGAPVVIGLELLAQQWEILPPEMRQRKVVEVARRLADAQRALGGKADTDGGRSSMWVLGALVVVALVAGGLWIARTSRGTSGPSARPSATVPTESDDEAKARRARVCDAARGRIYAGASIGPFDTEGWYAELWLAKRGDVDLGASPALSAIVAAGRLTPGADAELGALPDGTIEIADGFSPEEAARAKGWRSVTLRFGGRYAGAFLDPEARPRFIALADRTARTVGADLAGLYGRCAHLAFHDLGAWFAGPDPAGAAVALVFTMGMHAELAAVDRAALAKLDPVSDLDGLRKAGAKLDVAGLGQLVGNQGASVTTADGVVMTTFPVAGGTRATSASRVAARKLGVGTD